MAFGISVGKVSPRLISASSTSLMFLKRPLSASSMALMNASFSLLFFAIMQDMPDELGRRGIINAAERGQRQCGKLFGHTILFNLPLGLWLAATPCWAELTTQ